MFKYPCIDVQSKSKYCHIIKSNINSIKEWIDMGVAVAEGYRRNNVAEVLVLFILLVIITMAFAW
ncbi:hypothetical protein GCM10008018_12610 [Paenibacillus marchantiophytorum]|uniref:Uncharacterized protein n=1 Tax=Paenibacillus marchantiophytorum TaxID=1619310 RepID=A0ABQ2BT51_9BACL|nr:hypothetical protein GCM10008018_12610 [Paenibacillus marchantiophytorum]